MADHGNSNKNNKKHHLYEIRDSVDDDVFKYGISHDAIGKDGYSNRMRLWADLPVGRHDPATWTALVIRLEEYAQEPFRQAANTPVLQEAFDAMVIHLSDSQIYESDELSPGIILDLDREGNIVRIEILEVSKRSKQPFKLEWELKTGLG